MRIRRKGQGTLEYITVFAAIVAAILIFAYAKLKPAVETVMDSSADKITTAAETFRTSEIE
ncbi:MAG: class III signal peptide-containing protein [Candidatus Omnitrophica bacterium]|nr:class III signal peptide-containing protein [Candidatus Omnitrophota bacterium]